jgi:pyrimidine operon attenuation protein/uracil phosphoribosyltransferase
MPSTLLSRDRVRRILDRLAYQIVEQNRGGEGLVICGIRERGVLVAEALAERLEKIEGRPFPVQPLDVRPYLADADEEPTRDGSGFRIDGRKVILVDDVLFTGRTARAALDAITQYGRPEAIQLVVLVDRGHRAFPIQPDYVGRSIPTKYGEHVSVRAEDGGFAIYIEE